ncbi:acetone carboxylase [Aeromicrobium sp. A1-2]|uniref:acetone carboxylase n=1 Tax=Aeromicrobium sp. A1-2 TaxID=2107713 RepID=UPI0020B13A39|nr:acetone carboxylase [Aeromicrobium sp. A1-2]
MSDGLTCSAKDCTEQARHQVLWNNPKIHTPERRKIWLACDEHEKTLRAFLSARGFWKETTPSPDPAGP